MLARRLFVLAALSLATTSLLAGGGCCCFGPPPGACRSPGCGAAGCSSCQTACSPGHPCGAPSCMTCCFSIPKPIVWCGNESECGPGGCESCAACPTDCGILPALRRCMTCGKGCGEVYWGEWISDPPDCCDPCDQCYGQWTGPHGFCNLGPCQRLLAALHGYKYCPRPDCDEWCGPLCSKPACNSCSSCGGGGCSSCGGGQVTHMHGGAALPQGEVYYEGSVPSPGSQSHSHGQSILNENWDRQPAKPIPGKPIHKAQQPGPVKVSQAQPTKPAPQQPSYGRMVKTAGYFGR